jgi:predicted dehydrogenase
MTQRIISLCFFLFFLTQASLFAQSKFVMAGLTHGHSHWIFQKPFQGDFELLGIYESNPEVKKQFQDNYGLDDGLFFDDLEKMLDEIKPDGVLAFGPISDHIHIVKAAAPRGIHVMVEKPLAFRAQEAEAMKMLAEENGIHLLVNYETSWYPSTDALVHKAKTEEDQFGKIRKGVFHHGHKGPKEIGVGKEFLDWLTDPKQNGAGALVDFGCYGANIMTLLTDGEVPHSVTAITQTYKDDIYTHVEDEATIILTYKESQAIIQASWNWPFDRKDMDVYFEKGYLKAPEKERLDMRIEGQSEDMVQFLDKNKTGTYSNPFQYFAEVINGEINLPPFGLYTLENNVIVAKILDAAIESAKSGKTVYLEP